MCKLITYLGTWNNAYKFSHDIPQCQLQIGFMVMVPEPFPIDVILVNVPRKLWPPECDKPTSVAFEGAGGQVGTNLTDQNTRLRNLSLLHWYTPADSVPLPLSMSYYVPKSISHFQPIILVTGYLPIIRICNNIITKNILDVFNILILGINMILENLPAPHY